VRAAWVKRVRTIAGFTFGLTAVQPRGVATFGQLGACTKRLAHCSGEVSFLV
jgi:hypothetical protein